MKQITLCLLGCYLVSQVALLSCNKAENLLKSGLKLKNGAALLGGGTGDYYIDPDNGDDSYDGKSPSVSGTTGPWKTLAKVNATAFAPGDRILFKAGGAWAGQLTPGGSGTAADSITIDMYGSGSKPLIAGNGAVEDVIKLHNQQYWTIQNLELTNDAASEAVRRGVHILADSAAAFTCSGIHLRNLDIHHIKGISTATANGAGQNMYTNSAIHIRSLNRASRFNDLLVENNYIHDMSASGMRTVSTTNSPNADTSTFIYFTNVVIRNNTVSKTGSDGIIIGSCDGPVIEHNISRDAGMNGAGYKNNAGIWIHGCRNAYVQYNEAARTRWDGADAVGFDDDFGTTGTNYFQYNYSHENEGGVMLHMKNSADELVFRYNISQDDGAASGVGAKFNMGRGPAYVYNNTVYTTGFIKVGYPFATITPNTAFQNNIFWGSIYTTYSTDNTYNNNLYYGHNPPATDAGAITLNPMLVFPGSGGDDRALLDGYKLLTGSPAIGTGAIISNNGGKDYWGNTVAGTPNVGAYNGAAVTPASPGTNLLSNPGFESGSTGWSVSGAVVNDGNARTGAYALKTNASGSVTSQTVTGLLPNTFYTVEGYIKVVNSGETARLGIKNYGTGLPERSLEVNTTTYKQAMIVFKTGASATSVTIYVYKPSGSGAAYADDLYLYQR